MKKFAKLSLVAAVAVAGLSTTSSAASLEEAIKGVDVSGQFRYRFQDRSSNVTLTDPTGENYAGESANGTDVEIEVGVKVPVNENVTAVFKIDNANDDGNAAPTKGAVEIEDYYFSYVNGALTVNAGSQNIPGRMTDGADGDGIVALYNVGGFTLGAAAFNNHDFGGADLYSVIAMGNIGPVSLLAQYADVDNVLDAYNIKADASIDMIKVGVEYTETELDSGANNDDRSTFKAYVSGKAGIVSGTVAYVATGDNGSGSIHANAASTKAFAASVETPAEFLLWQMGSATVADLSAFAVDASVALTDKISVRAAYADGEAGNVDLTETLGQISYKMSKNLNTYARFSQFEVDNTESNRGRVEVKYSF